MTTTTATRRPTVGRATHPTAHTKWAREIARKVAARYRFARHSQEADDLKSVAVVELLKRAPHFIPHPGLDLTDPTAIENAFRGWMYRYIRSECAREARRMRNGGTYNTRREKIGQALVAEHLGKDADARPEIVELSEREWNALEDRHPAPDLDDERKAAISLKQCSNPDCPNRELKFKGTKNRRYCSKACRLAARYTTSEEVEK